LLRRLIRLRKLPYQMKTEKDVRAGLAASKAFAKEPEVLAKLRGVQFLRKASNPSELAASAVLEFEKDKDAQKALKLIRKSGGLTLDGVDTRASSRVAPAFTAEGIAQDRAREASEAEEDELGDWMKEFERNSLEFPTLDYLREVYVDPETDQWDFFERENLPGLTLPEWSAAAAERERKEKEEKQEEYRRREAERAGGAAAEHASTVLGRWAETVVKIDRVQKVVKGGKVMKYRALVVVGNLMGAGGFAYGKAAAPQDAVAKASRAAKQNLFYVERFKKTCLAYDVQGKHNNCLVNIYATPPSYGVIGAPLGQAILKQLGFASFTIKAHGRRSPASYVYATFDALSQLEPVEDLARRRGRRLLEIETNLLQGRRWPVNYRKYD